MLHGCDSPVTTGTTRTGPSTVATTTGSSGNGGRGRLRGCASAGIEMNQEIAAVSATEAVRTVVAWMQGLIR